MDVRNFTPDHLRTLLAVMALAPDTYDDYTNAPVGMSCGVVRPEYGPGVYDLQCQMCEATWTGVPGDPCWWCECSAQIQVEHQIDLLLTPPNIDPDDATYEARMGAWADRLVIGEKAGLITQAQADTAWQRATRKAKAS